MYVGNGYYELLNGKVKLNIEEIQELWTSSITTRLSKMLKKTQKPFMSIKSKF